MCVGSIVTLSFLVEDPLPEGAISVLFQFLMSLIINRVGNKRIEKSVFIIGI